MKRVELTDFAEITSLSAPQLSPDGRRVCFFSHKPRMEEDDYRTALCLLEGGAVRELPQARPGSAMWLDAQHLLHAVPGEPGCSAFAVTDVETDETAPLLSVPFPAGIVARTGETEYLLRGTVQVADARRLEGLTGEALEREKKAIADDHAVCEVFDEYPFWQNGIGVTNKFRTGLYRCDAATGKCVRITPELFDLMGAAYCEKTAQLVYTGVEFDTMRPNLPGVYRYDVKTGETVCLMPEETMEVGALAFCGDRLVLTACSHKGKTIAQMQDLYTMDTATGALTLLHAGELTYGNPVGTDCRFAGSADFQADENGVYAIIGVEEFAHLVYIDLQGNLRPVVAEDGAVDGFSVASSRTVVLTMRGQTPHELYELKNGELVQLTHFNDEYVASHAIAPVERLRFVNREGNEIHGMVLLPADYDASKRYPAILDIHGGPRAAYGEVYYHEMQYWAAQGYFVLFCNPTGSLGRGQYFGDVCGKTGQIDYLDIMDFVDRALETYPAIDPERLGVTGGSYGGFMTNWIIGHTDRFAAAASQRSTANNISNEATTGNGRMFTLSCLQPGQERSFELLWDQSPLKFIDNAVTPTLFIHALEDYCCYHVEALQMYTNLQRLGVETRLCLFKGENHSLSRTGHPISRVRRLAEITRWMDLHLKRQ